MCGLLELVLVHRGIASNENGGGEFESSSQDHHASIVITVREERIGFRSFGTRDKVDACERICICIRVLDHSCSIYILLDVLAPVSGAGISSLLFTTRKGHGGDSQNGRRCR